jgi:hypothetical protein
MGPDSLPRTNALAQQSPKFGPTVGFPRPKSLRLPLGVVAGKGELGLSLERSIPTARNGKVALRRQLKRRYVLAFFQKVPPCLVGIEACASSHHWSHKLQALGHTVRMMPPAYVKPYAAVSCAAAAVLRMLSPSYSPRSLPWLSYISHWAKPKAFHTTLNTGRITAGTSRSKVST